MSPSASLSEEEEDQLLNKKHFTIYTLSETALSVLKNSGILDEYFNQYPFKNDGGVYYKIDASVSVPAIKKLFEKIKDLDLKLN